MRRARRERALVALALLAACGRSLPEPGPEERAALAAAAAVPPEPSAGCRVGGLPRVRDERRTLGVGGEQRSYLIDAPAAPGDRPLPLVLSFHGFRGSAWRHRWWTGLGRLALREGFVAVHPEGHEGVRLLAATGRGWDIRPEETRDADFVRALLDGLERERCIDRRRVFATGMSNGAFFANLLGCVAADRLAAVAPVAGGLDLRACAPARPVPILFVYGRTDRIVPAEMVHGARDWWARVDGCGPAVERDGCTRYTRCAAEVVFCEGPQGHRWPRSATARVWRFFQAHPRP
ncbi:MAG TPA: PHB depolymerase family esterase [Verrucomicrobiae bacterium]|nr:PHB depolymerase family esterase [Verrucomicrobiae bacterium]